MIIYPPFIADTIPAFTTSTIKIPFVLNPAVGFNEVKSFWLQIKNYSDSSLVKTLSVRNNADSVEYDSVTKSGVVTFINDNENVGSETEKFLSGQYYKVQLAYSDTNTGVPYSWSIASIGRCIGDEAPSIKILGRNNKELLKNTLNFNSTSFTGVYQTALLSEPLYSYRFYVTNQKTQEIIADTGITLHNNDNDIVSGTQRISKHAYILNYAFEDWLYYTITYEITTINGFTDSVSYPITKGADLNHFFTDGKVTADQDYLAKENGYVDIQIGLVEDGVSIRGSFELQRTSDRKHWYTLTTFDLQANSDLDLFSWKDWSVEQGVVYIYAIRQYATNQSGITEYSKRIESNPIQIEFEHMYLSDGKRQLKIAYNPKVSSIKETILESKLETIGSQYPFFFRNNIIRYKEFPISGLLSYLADDNQLFMTDKELGLSDNLGLSNERTTNLTGYNFEAEKRFKLAVLDWLNNGEPKLFRSPAEGNYVVRLMNNSLSPNDQVSRMIHTFSSTAYETMDNTIENLQQYKLIDLPHIQDPYAICEAQTIYFSDLFAGNSATEKSIMSFLKDKQNNAKYPQPVQNSTIVSITWRQMVSNNNPVDYIVIDGQIYYNSALADFTTPSGFECKDIIVNRPSDGNMGSYLIISYEVKVDEAVAFATSTPVAADEFEKMIKETEDVLFSIPSGETLYGDGDNIGVLAILDKDKEPTGEYAKIYYTYSLIARRDETYNGTDPEDFNLVFMYNDETTEIIDCSDGQIRYYNSFDGNIKYEKGKGLILEAYVLLGGQREINSSRLGEFLLGVSLLGGS